jgi:hypothetical protein
MAFQKFYDFISLDGVNRAKDRYGSESTIFIYLFTSIFMFNPNNIVE